MDGFDDLLAPSRHALEDNPFADPFAKQPSSPDPWATPFATSADSHAFGNTSEHFSSLDSYGSSSLNNEFGSDPVEPINSPHLADDNDNEPVGRMQSPGFRESIPASFSETATIRPTTMEDYPSLSAATSPHLDNTSLSTHTTSPTPSDTQKTSGSTTFSSPQPSATESSFLSPLDNGTGLERSIVGLSLGGETLGGWQSETQTPWQTEHPISIPTKITHSDEDSDDDKPIMKTLKHHDQDDGPSVSVTYTQYSIVRLCLLVLRRHLKPRNQFETTRESNLYS